MKFKKKKLTAAAALAVGVCVFAGAAFASYNTSNGYATYKKAILGTMDSDNYTLNYRVSGYVDDKLIEGDGEELCEKFSKDGNANLSRINRGGDYLSKTYIQDNKRIEIGNDGSTCIYDMKGHDWSVKDSRTFNMFDSEDAGDRKMIRFGELLADTLIGDIKNNFVYVSGDQNTDRYELKLSSIQIPELFNAGLAAAFGVNGIDTYENPEYDENNLYTVLGDDPTIESVSCEFEVDNDGRLTYNLLSAQASGVGYDGNKHTAKIEMEIKMSDYGTTVPDTVDINSLKNIVWEDDQNTVSYIKTDDGKQPIAVMKDGKERKAEMDDEGNVLSIEGLRGFDTGEYSVTTEEID